MPFRQHVAGMLVSYKEYLPGHQDDEGYQNGLELTVRGLSAESRTLGKTFSAYKSFSALDDLQENLTQGKTY